MSLMRPTMLQYPSASRVARSPVCIQPAPSITFAGLFVVVPIAEHDGIAARAKFAGLAARNDAAVGVHDLHFEMRLNAADGQDATLQWIVGGTLETDRAGLGHAVCD